MARVARSGSKILQRAVQGSVRSQGTPGLCESVITHAQAERFAQQDGASGLDVAAASRMINRSAEQMETTSRTAGKRDDRWIGTMTAVRRQAADECAGQFWDERDRGRVLMSLAANKLFVLAFESRRRLP
ncbi:hypothetical protein MTO96_026834 [Rhipicephalus appendiculatus]